MSIRIAVMSDLHLEFEHRGSEKAFRKARPNGQPWLGPRWSEARDAGVDLVLLAGDTDAGATTPWAVEYAGRLADWMDCPVAMVAGNHEHYNLVYSQTMAELRGLAGRTPGVLFLENGEALIETAGGPLRLLGCTLWTDFRLRGHAATAMEIARWRLTDFVDGIFLDARTRFRPEDAARIHAESRAWLAGRFAEPFAGPTVVMTHHAPMARSLVPRRRDDALAPAYASDLKDEILEWAPDLWIHGHSHDPADYQVGATRVVANPRGYVGHELAARQRMPVVIEVSR